MAKKHTPRFLIVSNRLPVVISRQDDDWNIAPGSGGLITALEPIMSKEKGLWVGWPGCGDEAPLQDLMAQFEEKHGYRLSVVPLSEEDVEKYYRGFSNETLWPLFHDLLGFCRFSLENWRTYQEVNQRFAQVVVEKASPDELIWVHDYQLALVGQYLREYNVSQTLAYFLHIPFPSPDLFQRLPWKIELIRALMSYDLLGFQTLRDRRNFITTALALLPDTEVLSRHRYHTLLRYGKQMVRVGNFPISIDFDEFNGGARSKEVQDAAWYLHENLHGRQLVLGVDRLDYTKGIPERFLAFERALEKYPEMMTNISLLQVVVPSRTLVPDYQNLKETLDQTAGRINARFGSTAWSPIHYVFRSLDRTQLLARYRSSEIALITPLRDGMNLVAKEYCAASVDNNGVLILSEFAGAADQLGKGALLVNPYDIEGTADAIYRAYTMDQSERRHRMSLMRSEVRRNDVHRWLQRFTEAVSS